MAYCSNCGTPYDPQDRFCTNCGHQLPVLQNVSTSQPNSTTSQLKTKGNKKFLMFGVPVIAIILIISTLFIIYQHSKVTYTKNNPFLGEWKCIDMDTGNLFANLFGNAITSYTDTTIKFSSDGKVRAEILDIAAGNTTYTLSKDGKTATFRIDNVTFTANLQGDTMTVTMDDASEYTIHFIFEKTTTVNGFQ